MAYNVKAKEGGLTPKQKEYVKYYCGSPKETHKRMIDDGIKIGKRTIDRMSVDPKVREAIRLRDKDNPSKGIATRIERQVFWSKTMADKDVAMRDRLAASKLLGSSEKDFTEKLELSGKVSISDLISDIDSEDDFLD